jgi:tRNA uridine 5-carboxymethylaminomethyl modification enzyme
MFTSRAEFRLLLRSDNADRRLTPLAERLGLVPADVGTAVREKERRIAAAVRLLDTVRADGRTLAESLRRPAVHLEDLVAANATLAAMALSPAEMSEVEAEVKYAGYVERQALEVERLRRMEHKRIPAGFDYAAIPGLSNEARGRLLQRRPLTLGEASRIAGVRPADVNLLLVLLARRERGGAAAAAR